MEARLNPSLAPRFWELDPVDAFQPLCVDLLVKEPGIASADEYGINGQGQQGIDILGKDISGQIVVVGQCKCNRPEKFKAADVIKAADEFYKHYEYWKEQGVNHFILMVACDLSDRKIQDEIRNQRTRFTQIGIHFEAWSGSILRNKLMPHPTIAQRHINSQEVLRNICGPTVQGLIFTPNASIETTLQELREAMREPDSYSADIENLFIEEAKNVISVVQNSSFVFSTFDATSCNEYLQPLIECTEKLVRLSAELIKLSKQERFIEVLVRSLTILAQDPLKFSNELVSHTPGIPEIRLYPLALMIYTIYIIGTERKSTKLLQEMTKIYFKSKRSSYLEKKNLPAILEYMFFSSPNTQRFFKKINSNLIPIPTTIKGTLLPWLENYLIFDENAYWSGEFILSLTFLDPKDMQKYPALFPSIYSYFSESIPSLECLLKDKKWLKELFPDIEDRLQLFDEFCIKASQEPPRNYETYEPMRGFCGNTLNLYHNS